MFKRVQTKILVLVSFVAVILILALTINWLNETTRWNVLYTERCKDDRTLLENVIDVKGENLQSFVYDYSYWDEMVNFVSSQDKKWASFNIVEPMGHFNIQAAWVLNTDFSAVFSYNSFALQDFNYPISREKLKTLISKKAFSHFFFLTPKGLMEIRSAPIQPSNDTERKTKPAGYFLVGRLWTDNFIKVIESITSTEIYFSDNAGQVNINNKKKYSIVTSFFFNGWDNKPVGKLISIDEPMYIKEALQSSKTAFRNHVIFAYLLLITIAYSLVKLINSPLKILSKSLALNSSSIIEPLLKDSDEFGRFARLIKEFFEQKSSLVTEITERKKIEQNLRENEERLKLVLEGSNEGFWDLDIKKGKIEINEEWFYSLDYNKDEIPRTAKGWRKLIHPDDIQKVTAMFFKHLRNEEPMFEIEHRIVNHPGDWKWILNRGRVVSWEKDCKPARVAGTITDITFKKNAEELIKQNERKYGFLVGNVKDVIFQTDAEGVIIYINPAWYELTGYNPGESLGGKLIDYIHDDDKERNIEFFKAILQGKISSRGFETRYLSKDSAFKWVEVLISSVRENDLITGLTGTLHDITWRKQVEEEIFHALERERELNELKSRFVSMVSHEYRTPLASILSSAELLKIFSNDMAEDEKIKHISNVIKNVDNMNEI
jgi:PAS domain S-box-containing protein